MRGDAGGYNLYGVIDLEIRTANGSSFGRGDESPGRGSFRIFLFAHRRF